MVLQYNKPKDLNWFPSFVAQHKIPYGTYVLNELMDNMFKKTEQISIPPFEFLNANQYAEGTYFLVDNKIKFGDTELESLLEWTAEGNSLFIASSTFEPQLLDTLDLDVSGLFADFGEEQNQVHRLVNPKLNPEVSYAFEKNNYSNFFRTIDTLNTTVIGLVDNYEDEDTFSDKHFNVIQKSFGDGEIILSTFPKAFTNYFILKDKHREYTAGLLSYLDDSKTIYIDNYHKSGKTFYTSPMHIFLNTKEFKWAYYLILIGAVIYVIFEGKRKQRAIPIVIPLKNQTLAFTRTIGNMYYEQGKRKPISEHKIEQFLEYIRSHFYLQTQQLDNEFYQNLASRSSHTPDEISSMFKFIERIKNQTEVTDLQLKKLNTLIEKFKHKAHGR